MEKSTPHCKLTIVKEMVAAGKVRVSNSALKSAAVLGISQDGVIAVVASLSRTDFYKSMTTYDDHKIWQDVYRPTTAAGNVYLKITVIDDVLVVSFKEL